MTKNPLLYGFALLCVLLPAFPQVADAQFADVTSGPLVTSGTTFGVAWADFDKDGDFTKIELKLDGETERARVPTAWLGPTRSEGEQPPDRGQEADAHRLPVSSAHVSSRCRCR